MPGVPVQRSDVLVVRTYRYNVRWAREHLEAGVPEQIEGMQGAGGVWYAGGLLSHWNVSSIQNYNIDLVQRFLPKVRPRRPADALGAVWDACLPLRHGKIEW